MTTDILDIEDSLVCKIPLLQPPGILGALWVGEPQCITAEQVKAKNT